MSLTEDIYNADYATACACGAHAVDEILSSGYGVAVAKAKKNPLTPAGFDRIVASLANAQSRSVAGSEATAMNAALNALDVKWDTLTGTEIDSVIEAARMKIAAIPSARTIAPIKQTFMAEGKATITGSRKGERFRLKAPLKSKIGVDMTKGDQRVLDHMVDSQALFVRNEYGRRSVKFSDRARALVSEHLEAGLGTDQLTDILHTEMRSAGNTKSYWNVIAGVFVNRSRTYGQLASYDEAGIQEFTFEAILDQVTTDQCATLHGRVFKVGAGLDRYRRVAESGDPESVIDIQPWIRVGKDPATGKKIMFTENRSGRRRLVGEIVQTRTGKLDSTGTQRNVVSNAVLQDEIGAFMPPLHARCRSTIVPVV